MLEDLETLYQLVVTLIAAIAALYGWFEKKTADAQKARATEAEKEAEAANEYAYDVQAFFDPENTEVWVPPAGTPERSYKMSESVKKFMISGASIEDQQKMLNQVAEAEAAGLIDYKVAYSNGYYIVSYGQLAGSAVYA